MILDVRHAVVRDVQWKTISVEVKTHSISHKDYKEVGVGKKIRKTFVVGNVVSITQKVGNHVFAMLPNKKEKGKCR